MAATAAVRPAAVPPGNTVLTGVSVVSATDAWAVGYAANGVVWRVADPALERHEVGEGHQPQPRRNGRGALASRGAVLRASQVGEAIADIVSDSGYSSPAYLLTSAGLKPAA